MPPLSRLPVARLYAQLELEERTSIARVRRHRDHNEDGGEANGSAVVGGGRGRARGRRGGGGGEGGEFAGENGEEGGEGRGRRVPPVAENSVYIKGFPETTSEDDIRAEVILFFFELKRNRTCRVASTLVRVLEAA